MHHACTLSYRQAKQPGALIYEQRHTARSRREREKRRRRTGFHGQAHEAATRSICKQADTVSGLQITAVGRQHGGGRTGRPLPRKGSLYGATIQYTPPRAGWTVLRSYKLCEKGSSNTCRIKTRTHAFRPSTSPTETRFSPVASKSLRAFRHRGAQSHSV